MILYSTNNKDNKVNLKEAVLNAFPKDRGLYMPESIKALPESFYSNIEAYTFHEIAFLVSQNLIGNFIPESDIYQIVEKAINFPAPLFTLSENLHTLELFHGPTLAFKDVALQFLGNVFEYILKHDTGIDYWLLLTYSQNPISLDNLKSKNERYQYISVFESNKIGVCNTAFTPYFEKGLIEPHILLREIKALIKTGNKPKSLIYINPIK